MCHGPGSRPPLPPVSGGSGSGTELTLTSADKARFSSFFAEADGKGAGIVILPDVRGLHSFYYELTERFAGLGLSSIAIDYFGRTAGLGPRADDFEFMPHVLQSEPGAVAQDVASAVDYLRSPTGGECTSVFTVGFCFGGRASFNQAARGHGLAGVIGFYGKVAPNDENDSNAPLAFVDKFECPVLGLFGGADQSIPTNTVDDFRTALEKRELQNEIVVYEGAPHSFFDRSFEQFSKECDDAWTRITAFVERNSA